MPFWRFLDLDRERNDFLFGSEEVNFRGGRGHGHHRSLWEKLTGAMADVRGPPLLSGHHPRLALPCPSYRLVMGASETPF